MDSDLDFLEHLLQDRDKESIAKRVLAVAPFSDQDYRLKKTVLLRTIECQVHDASISETILETLEKIEALDVGQGIATSDAMKAAYLAVAADFITWTLRLNRADGSELERQIRNRMSELEAQPPGNGTTNMVKVNGGNLRCGSELGLQQMSGVQIQLQEVGAGSSSAPSPTVSRGGLVSNDFVQVGCGFTNRQVGSLADDQALSFVSTTKGKEIPRSSTRGPVKIKDAKDLDEDLPNTKYVSLSTPEVCCLVDWSTPEVSKALEALKSLELRAVVIDPLPNALLLSETIRSDPLATKSVNDVSGSADNQSVEKGAQPVQSHSDNLGNMSSSHQNDVPQSSGKETDVPNPPANLGKGTESVQINDPGPSLMERNTTAHTYEWDDSIDMSQGKDTDMLHLPSPKSIAVSPLKKYENNRFTKRRKINRWSSIEEDALRTGVQKFGEGNWKLIWNSCRDIFEKRNPGDLKDKWRNMTKLRHL